MILSNPKQCMKATGFNPTAILKMPPHILEKKRAGTACKHSLKMHGMVRSPPGSDRSRGTKESTPQSSAIILLREGL